jgi:DNA polymerase-3 subunit gamma/tau
MTDRWRAAVAEVERASPAAANALKQGVVVAMADGEIALRLPPGMALGTAERRRAEIEAVFARHFGRPTRLVLSEGPPPQAEASAPPQSLAATEQAERAARTSRVKDAARAHPNIDEAAKILDGEIAKIEEL